MKSRERMLDDETHRLRQIIVKRDNRIKHLETFIKELKGLIEDFDYNESLNK